MPQLDAEEQALLNSVELGEWQSISNLAAEINRYQRYAQAQVSATEAVNIELPSRDLQALREIAQQSDISVSLLMASVLHQFIAGQQESINQ